MRRVIFNQKGGVGKTSITCNLAAAFAKKGHKVLVIDLDAQANSSQYLLGQQFNHNLKNIAHFFESTLSFRLFKDSLAETIHGTEFASLYVIPASKELSDLQAKLESRYKVMKLSQALEVVASLHSFDQVLIDTPPALNFYSMSALLAADKVLIPFDCDEFSAQAIDQVVATVSEVKEDYRPNLEVEGIIINHFQSQARLPKSTIDSILQKGYPVLTPYLSSSVILKESHFHRKPLAYFRSGHKLTKEYEQLADVLLGNLKPAPLKHSDGLNQSQQFV